MYCSLLRACTTEVPDGPSTQPRLRDVKRSKVPCLPAVGRRHFPTGCFEGPVSIVSEVGVSFVQGNRDIIPGWNRVG